MRDYWKRHVTHWENDAPVSDSAESSPAPGPPLSISDLGASLPGTPPLKKVNRDPATVPTALRDTVGGLDLYAAVDAPAMLDATPALSPVDAAAAPQAQGAEASSGSANAAPADACAPNPASTPEDEAFHSPRSLGSASEASLLDEPPEEEPVWGNEDAVNEDAFDGTPKLHDDLTQNLGNARLQFSSKLHACRFGLAALAALSAPTLAWQAQVAMLEPP